MSDLDVGSKLDHLKSAFDFDVRSVLDLDIGSNATILLKSKVQAISKTEKDVTYQDCCNPSALTYINADYILMTAKATRFMDLKPPLTSKKMKAFFFQKSSTPLPDVELKAKVLSDFVKIHEEHICHLCTGGVVKKWGLDPYSHGAFAIFTPFQMRGYEGFLVQPEGRIYFAGEHRQRRPHAWIETAMKSALRAAKDINDNKK
ncbi:L-amino-acid oxidase-like [Paramisgurnus dabryanus]|uniref:L-amino-acid oxidase-like n=1 Tax=Paramisgurnus dabryanus TaxID=90735 RepID=UPI003CCF81EA